MKAEQLKREAQKVREARCGQTAKRDLIQKN